MGTGSPYTAPRGRVSMARYKPQYAKIAVSYCIAGNTGTCGKNCDATARTAFRDTFGQV
jgi:hypothetical protein